MADTKISDELPAGPLDGTELTEIVQAGNNRKATTQDIANLAVPFGTTGTGSTVLQDEPAITSPTFLGTVSGAGAVPNSVLQHSSLTIAGHSVALGGSQTLAASDLTNGTTGAGTVVLGSSPTIDSTTLTGSTHFPGSGIWNSSGNIGLGTTLPAALLDIEQNAGGTVNHTVMINKTEAISQDTEGGQNAALYVTVSGANASGGGNISQSTAGFFAATQTGQGDCCGIMGEADQSGSGIYAAFGGFFSAVGRQPQGSAVAAGLNTVNLTGSNLSLGTYLASNTGAFGIDAPSSGNGSCTAALLIRNAGQPWDTGVFIGSGVVSYAMYGPGFNIDASGNFNHTSDVKLKENISQIEDGVLEKLSAIKPSSYNLKEGGNGRRYAGILAQEVETLMPEAVSQDIEGNLQINDSAVIAYLIKAVQELHKEVAGLREQKSLPQYRMVTDIN